MRKIILWGAVIFAAFYVLKQPTAAAHAAEGAFGWLHQSADSLARFFTTLGGHK